MTYTDLNENKALYEYLIRLADDRLILSQRLGEWCGHGPILEEDIAMTNISLDLLGQAKAFYEKASELNDNDKSADDLVFLRNEREYRNVQLVEQDNEDFAYTMTRQFFFDVFEFLFYKELLDSSNEDLKSYAQKNIKETKYHVRHTTEWMKKLGGGTEESNSRLKDAVDYLWMYTGELFYMDEVDKLLIEKGIVPDLSKFKDEYYKNINNILEEADVDKRDPDAWMQSGGRKGIHSEFLGHILAEMQYVPRSMPDAKW